MCVRNRDFFFLSFRKNSKHVNNHGKRSPSWENNHLPSKRARRDSQQLDQKKRKTTAELNAECETDIK